jgi:hypothetical protein
MLPTDVSLPSISGAESAAGGSPRVALALCVLCRLGTSAALGLQKNQSRRVGE